MHPVDRKMLIRQQRFDLRAGFAPRFLQTSSRDDNPCVLFGKIHISAMGGWNGSELGLLRLGACPSLSRYVPHSETSRRAGCRRSARFQTEGTANTRIGAHFGPGSSYWGFPLFASLRSFMPLLTCMRAPATLSCRACEPNCASCLRGASRRARPHAGRARQTTWRFSGPFVLDPPGRSPGFSAACPVEFSAHILPRFDCPPIAKRHAGCNHCCSKHIMSTTSQRSNPCTSTPVYWTAVGQPPGASFSKYLISLAGRGVV